MKYWKRILSCGLTYEEAKESAEKYRPYYITREEWDGVHFFNADGEYCILLKTGEVIINPKEVYDTDKDYWMVVTITKEAVDIINKYTKIV